MDISDKTISTIIASGKTAFIKCEVFLNGDNIFTHCIRDNDNTFLTKDSINYIQGGRRKKKGLQSPGGRQGSSSSEGSSDGPTDSSCQFLKQQKIYLRMKACLC